jgi:hypothetical protein
VNPGRLIHPSYQFFIFCNPSEPFYCYFNETSLKFNYGNDSFSEKHMVITCRRCGLDMKTHHRCTYCGHTNWPYFVFWTFLSAVLLFFAMFASQPGFPRMFVLWLGLMFFPYKSLIHSSQAADALDKIVILVIGGGGIIAVGIWECGPGFLRWVCIGFGILVIAVNAPKIAKLSFKYLVWPLVSIGILATLVMFFILVSKIGLSHTLANIRFSVGETIRKPIFLIPIIIASFIPATILVVRGGEIVNNFGKRILLFAAGLLVLAATLAVVGVWTTAWYTPK